MMADGATEIAADASAQTMWANTQLIAGLVIAFFAPVLGAYADSTGRRMPWIVFDHLCAGVGCALVHGP
jgi:UMF1 family MFS transporter